MNDDELLAACIDCGVEQRWPYRLCDDGRCNNCHSFYESEGTDFG
jgi:hypothetical protein